MNRTITIEFHTATMAFIGASMSAILIAFFLMTGTTEPSGGPVERQLPYARPHMDYVRNEDDKRCVSWMFVDSNLYFVLCEDETPYLLRMNRLESETGLDPTDSTTPQPRKELEDPPIDKTFPVQSHRTLET